jgi:hypothetical protein
MQDQSAGVGFEQQVFRTAAGAANRAPTDEFGELWLDWPAEATIVHDEPKDSASDDVWLDAATGSFDFRKFWHGLAFDRGGLSLVSHGPPNDLQRFARLRRLIKHERLWVAAGPSCKENPCGARIPSETQPAATPTSDCC